MFDRDTIREVRQRTDLVQLIDEFVPLRRKGARHFGRCPFHQEKTASFSVSNDVGLAFCFGCKWGGDALRFFMDSQGVSFPEAVRALARRAGVEIPEDRTPEEIAEDRRQHDLAGRLLRVCEVAAAFFERQLHEAEWSELARGALDERGVTAETAATFRLGYAPASWDALAAHLRTHQLSPHDATLAGLLVDGRHGPRDRFRHRLMFPILDAGGRVVAFSGRILPVTAGMEGLDEGLVPEDAGKYVNSPETPLYKKGELLYGLTAARMSIRQRERALLVEGNFDVVQMHQHGFTETVAPLGTSFTDAQAKLLRRHTDRVTFLFDGDGAGRRAARAAHAVAERGGYVARVGVLPPDADPDSYLRAHGAPALTATLGRAVGIVEWILTDALAHMGDTVPERVAGLREIVPLLATVLDPIERAEYVRLAARALYLDEPRVREALRQYEREAAREAREAPLPGAQTIDRRPGLTALGAEGDTSDQAERRAMATGAEALLYAPALLATDEAAQFVALLPVGPLAEVLRLAREGWREEGRIDGAQLLEACPEARLRQWVAARLQPLDDEATAALCPGALADARARLARCHAARESHRARQESAREGARGNALGEVRVLEDARKKRERERASGTPSATATRR